jgi:membrane protein implicated in regulation of membrane protease activity
MKFEYQLSEEDFLAYQLYTAFHSDSVKRKMRNGRLWLSLGALMLGALCFMVQYLIMGVYFVLIAVLVLLFFSRYFRWRYQRHFRNHIREHYTERMGVTQSIEFTKDHLRLADKTSEGKVDLSEIKEVVETNQQFFVQLASGISVIVPKNEINAMAFRQQVTDLKIDVVQATA